MRSLRLLLFALIVSLLTVRAGADNPRVFQQLNAGQKQTVVVYGTSLTHGGAWAEGVKKWFDDRYPGLVTFINSGAPGQNSDYGVKNLRSRVLNQKPDLVFVEFSFNDAHDKFAMPVAKGAENLEKMVGDLQALDPQPTIVLQIMNVPWDTPKGTGSSSHRPQLSAFNENYRVCATKHGLALLDHSIAWQKLKDADEARYQRYIPDGTHPSKEGSMAVTFPTIKEWLEKSSAK